MLRLVLILTLSFTLCGVSCAEPVILEIDRPLAPPAWALLQRELLRTNEAACREFFEKYFDERGYLLCVERWGGDDGPDDAIENVADWPLLHAASKYAHINSNAKIFFIEFSPFLRRFLDRLN